MYKVVFLVGCLSVALAQYEHFPSNVPVNLDAPFNNLDSPSSLKEKRLLAEGGEDSSSGESESTSISDTNNDDDDSCDESQSTSISDTDNDDGDSPDKSKPPSTTNNKAPKCENGLSPHPTDKFKFILGGQAMSCAPGTYFDLSICNCNHTPK